MVLTKDQLTRDHAIYAARVLHDYCEGKQCSSCLLSCLQPGSEGIYKCPIRDSYSKYPSRWDLTHFDQLLANDKEEEIKEEKLEEVKTAVSSDYHQGGIDTWELVRQIHKLPLKNLKECFGGNWDSSYDAFEDLFSNYSPMHVKELYDQWIEKNTYHVGDIVYVNDLSGTGHYAVLTQIESSDDVFLVKDQYNAMTCSGAAVFVFKNIIKKTGRNIADQLDKILALINNEVTEDVGNR